jgi:nucleoside-diphosphate-sugar epimerase
MNSAEEHQGAGDSSIGSQQKIVITGSAGLVGQNLIARLEGKTNRQIVAIDKHPGNVEILKQYHPSVRVLLKDLARDGGWEDEFEDCRALVIGHAQIGGTVAEDFTRNNVIATKRVMDAAVRHKVPYIVHISSSVVNSMVVDDYTETKKEQEVLVDSYGIKHIVLRPTLMFGWFDRKHLGWLARFMKRVPVFPIPGDGRYIRQPLFVGDFCETIISAIENETTGTYNITGQEKIFYIDLIRAVKRAVGAKSHIIKLPYNLFWLLLKVNEAIDKNPAFTTKQLNALITPEVFEVIDWPRIFGVCSTPLDEALKITYCDPTYSEVALEF